METNVRTNIIEAIRKFERLNPDQFEFVAASALTKTGQIAKQAATDDIIRSIDRPTRYTQNATYLRPATKQRLVAEVGYKDWSGKGTAANKYLAPLVNGGPRNVKRFERALIINNIMPQGYYAVPGGGVPLDAHGNISGGFITSLLAYLRANPEMYSNRTARSVGRNKKMRQFFAINDPNHRLPMGIYQRLPGQYRLVIAFVKQPIYSKRLHFFEVVEKAVRDNIEREVEQAIKIAIETRHDRDIKRIVSQAFGIRGL